MNYIWGKSPKGLGKKIATLGMVDLEPEQSLEPKEDSRDKTIGGRSEVSRGVFVFQEIIPESSQR